MAITAIEIADRDDPLPDKDSASMAAFVVSTSTDAPTTSIKFIFILFGIFLSLGLSLEESTPM